MKLTRREQERRLKCLKVLLEYQVSKKKARKRKFWVNKLWLNRSSQGCYNNLVNEKERADQNKFFNFHRMEPNIFNILAQKLQPKLQKYCASREVISVKERLSLTLRYLASGDSMVSISYLYRVSKTSISRIIREMCEALWDVLSGEVFPKLRTSKWQQIAEEYEQNCNFPFCIGAIDEKHCVVHCVSNSGSKCFNYKGTDSIVLMGVCDSNYKFLSVDIGCFSDGGIIKNTNFGNAVVSKFTILNLPKQQYVNGLGQELPYVFVADEAFPLLENMRPFPGRKNGLPQNQAIFNYRLSRAKRTIENAFGILSSRWRILKRTIIATQTTALQIIKSTVVLHNFLREFSASYIPERCGDSEDEFSNIINGNWRNDSENQNNLNSIGRMGSNNFTSQPSEIRNNFT